MQKNPLEWLNLMVSEPYYLFHFLTFFSYFVVRTSASQLLSPHISHHLLHREIQAVLAFALLSAYKVVRSESWEAFIVDSLFYAKLFLIAISMVLDYHLTLWYIVVFSVIYILTQPPAFQALGTSCKLTPLQLEALLTEGNTSRFWLILVGWFLRLGCLVAFFFRMNNSLPNCCVILVEFRASCSSPCIRASRCLPELSVTYSNKNLSFGIVDLGLFPNAAEKFGISLSAGMDQLPTYILFENATEVTRFPEWNFEVKPPSAPITKRLLSRHFELDRHLLAYVNGR